MGIYHLGLVVWCAFEGVLSTFVIFGWAQLLEILESEQYFLSYCGDEANSNLTISPTNISNLSEHSTVSNDANTCSEQDSILRLVYTISVFVSFASVFVSGKYLDMFGFRKTRILASIIFLLAGGAMLVSTYDMHKMLFLGLFLTAFGGGCYISILIKVCGVLPRRRYTAISIISGAGDSSAIMLLVFKLCYNAGISFKTIIIAYYSFVFGHGLLFTFTIFPRDLPAHNTHTDNCVNNDKDFRSSNTDCNDLKSDTNGLSKRENVLTATTQTNENGSSENQVKEKRDGPLNASNRKHHAEGISLFSIIRRRKFIVHTCFVSITSLRSFIFTGTINTLLKRLTDDKSKVDFYLTILGVIQFFGILLAFVPGFLIDWSPANRHPNFSIILSFGITGLISIILTVVLLIPILEFQVVSFLLYALLRAFVYSTHGSFIMKEFPLYHVGALNGLSLLISAIVSLFQIPMFALLDGPYNSNPTWINLGMLVVQVLIMIHPLNLWKCSKDADKSSNKTLKITGYSETKL